MTRREAELAVIASVRSAREACSDAEANAGLMAASDALDALDSLSPEPDAMPEGWRCFWDPTAQGWVLARVEDGQDILICCAHQFAMRDGIAQALRAFAAAIEAAQKGDGDGQRRP